MASHDSRAQESRLPAVHRRLAQPRPPLERALNQYVETPLRPAPPPPPPQVLKASSKPKPKPSRDANFALVTLPVTTQPTKPPGIMCTDCGRCRCASCKTPRPLPSALLCGTSCLCSSTNTLDYVTCMCLPKACAYHCGSQEEEEGPSWWCLGLSAVLCPCLLCYLPCKGLIRLCEACHRHFSTPGCRCTKIYSCPPPPTLEKRLLDSPE